MPGQAKSARQQYKHDVLVQAAEDALEALEVDRITSASDLKKKRLTGRPRRILKTALKEVGEYDD